MITQKQLKKIIHYTPDTGVFIWVVPFGKKTKRGDVAGGSGSDGGEYVRIGIRGVRYYAHRLAWIYQYGEIPPKMEIDHINRIKNDNRIINLRIVDHRINSINTGLRSDNKTGVKGVYWYKRDKKWEVKIRVGGKQIHIGRFFIKKDAIAARKAAEKKYGFDLFFTEEERQELFIKAVA